jgi:hypothetical protein
MIFFKVNFSFLSREDISQGFHLCSLAKLL